MAEEEQAKRRRVPVGDDGKPVQDPAGDQAPAEPVCDCPILDPEDWHEVESDWTDIQFIRGALPAVAGVPMGYSGVREKLAERAAAAGATVPEDAMLLLGDGRLRRPVLLEVEAEAEHRDIEMPGGHAWSRLLSASFGAMKPLMKETKEMARAKYGRDPDDMWIWYLTCAECSQARNWETLFVAHYRPD